MGEVVYLMDALCALNDDAVLIRLHSRSFSSGCDGGGGWGVVVMIRKINTNGLVPGWSWVKPRQGK